MSTKGRYERGRLFLESIKRAGCVICGEQEISCLDFHHVNEADKSFNLTGIANTKSLAALRTEVDKCVVVCASCHRKLHAGVVELPETGATNHESHDPPNEPDRYGRDWARTLDEPPSY